MESSYNKEGQIAAVVAYLTIIGCIIAYFINKDEKNQFASFHIRQAIGVHLAFYLLGALVSVFNSWLISSSFYIFILVLWGYGIITAFQLERKETPILGPYFQQWFTFVE